MADPILEEERQHLSGTIATYRQLAEAARELFDALPRMHAQDPDLLGDLMLQTHNRIARLTHGEQRPYFARIDFTAEGAQETERCYIGKVGISDDDNRIVTVDWRAPISTLYYDSPVGPASYEAPGGAQQGELSLKRQFEISFGQLLSYNDVDTVSSDELLQPYLNAAADTRLKNIVATIQSEQNRIIRERLKQTLVVQGVAGSGKTTVALHRIAYLVYSCRDSVSPGQFLVLGPNPFFIRYISAVLPDLDVENVSQLTFEQLIERFIAEPFTLLDSARLDADFIEGRVDGAPEAYKASLCYRDALECFLQRFEQSVCPDSGFSLRGFELISREAVRQAFADAASPGATIAARVEKCMLLLRSRLHSERDRLELLLSEHFRPLYAAAKGDALMSLHRDRAYIEKELEKDCLSSLKNFFSGVRVKTLALYRKFLTECGDTLPDCPCTALLKKETLARLRKKEVSPADLPALCYLRLRLGGPGKYADFRHCIVDEAQDLGPFHYLVLRGLLCGSSFTIVGDLMQSIYQYRAISGWEEVLSLFPGSLLCEMRRSYRTTIEIMQAANRVSDFLSLPAASPVIRHGEPVRLKKVTSEELPALLAREVEGFSQAGCKSIAIICKTVPACEELFAALRAQGVAAERITGTLDDYSGGVCILPAHLSKGLEFDGVLLPDVSLSAYSPQRRMDMHLLYVAMTRALHRLCLFCPDGEEPPAPLAGL